MIELKIKPNKELLKIRDIEIDTTGLNPDSKTQVETINTTLPRLYYYNLEIPAQSISKLNITSTTFLPECHIVFTDTYGILHSSGYPADNATVTVIYPTMHPNLAPIFMEFKVTNYNIELARNSSAKKITIKGVCNIENLLVKKYLAYENLTSYDVFSKFATDFGLGLMTNVNSSNDKMNWLNPGQRNYSFLQEITNKAWIGESSFIWTFVDFYYNLNYIDVEKSLSQDITEIKWIAASTIDNSGIIKDDTQPIQLVSPSLSNDMGFRGSNAFFSGEKILNQSTDISLQRGYLRNIHYYDIDGNWTDKAGSYKQYTLDTITSKGIEKTAIYLKDSPGNLDFYNNNKSFHFMGKIDTKNMHADYLWAKAQNEENIFDLQKITMQIILPTPNYNIRRFEKINLFFVNNNVPADAKKANVKLNGEWLVTGISFDWNGTAFWQTVNIVKRELTVLDI